MKPVYLYEIPRESKIWACTNRAPKGEEITFRHLDGLYSFCTFKDGEVVHLHAMTPLEIHKDHYHIISTPRTK